MLTCEIYAIVTLTITTLWVHSARGYSLRTLALVMFLPGLFAPWFTEDPYFLHTVLGLNKLAEACTYSVLAVLCVLVAMVMTLAVDVISGWGKLTRGFQSRSQLARDLVASLTDTSGLVPDFLRAAGEEVGWRCYLLPGLLAHYSTTNALLYSGVIWALFHLPVMVLLTGQLNVSPRWKTVAAQLSSCVVYAHVCGLLAIHSGFSVWAPTVFHAAWNRAVPRVFGSVYTQEPGLVVEGRQWLINPEGLAGAVAGVLLVGLYCGSQ